MKRKQNQKGFIWEEVHRFIKEERWRLKEIQQKEATSETAIIDVSEIVQTNPENQ